MRDQQFSSDDCLVAGPLDGSVISSKQPNTLGKFIRVVIASGQLLFIYPPQFSLSITAVLYQSVYYEDYHFGLYLVNTGE